MVILRSLIREKLLRGLEDTRKLASGKKGTAFCAYFAARFLRYHILENQFYNYPSDMILQNKFVSSS